MPYRPRLEINTSEKKYLRANQILYLIGSKVFNVVLIVPTVARLLNLIRRCLSMISRRATVDLLEMTSFLKQCIQFEAVLLLHYFHRFVSIIYQIRSRW